jgi:dTDP-4-dehydrorhamnose reductase
MLQRCFERRLMRIVVTGGQGQIARSLRERGGAAGVEVLPVARPDIDLARPESIHTALAALAPGVIVNAAAFTAVDLAESESERALAINGAGAGAVALAAADLKAPIIHLSTDYVFDGLLDRPYVENDAANPTTAYGRSKLAGEKAVAAAQPDHAVLRTAWVYSPFGKNFIRTMLSLAAQRAEVSVVADQRGSPTSALDMADGIIAVARQMIERPKASALRGVFHLVGSGEATWAEFADAVFAESRAVGGPSARVIPIPSSAYPTPAQRPANSRLNGDKILAAYGVRLPAWRDSLRTCVRRLLAEGAF